MIRRELPRTEDAGWVAKPYRTEVRRILLSVSSRSVTCTAGRMGILNLVSANRTRIPETGLQQFLRSVSSELIRLKPIGQVDHAHGGIGPELGGDGGGSAVSGGIAVQHEDDAAEMTKQSTLLRLVQFRAH